MNYEEQWKIVPGYCQYVVSSFGRVVSLPRFKVSEPRLLDHQRLHSGHLRFLLTIDGKPKGMLAHRLVALAFLPQDSTRNEVNHIDGNPGNNHLDNLEWCTRSENLIHAHRMGLKRVFRGSQKPLAKLSEETAENIMIALHAGQTCASLARQYSVSEGCVRHIKKGRTWQHVKRKSA